jgi:hypothetical protein
LSTALFRATLLTTPHVVSRFVSHTNAHATTPFTTTMLINPFTAAESPRHAVAVADRPASRRLDPVKAFDMRLRGMTYRSIAAHFGVSSAHVAQSVRKLTKIVGSGADALVAYQVSRAKVLASAELLLVEHIAGNKKRLQSARLGELAQAFHRIHEAGRLERGESTANIGLHATLIAEVHADLRVGDADLVEPQTSFPIEPVTKFVTTQAVVETVTNTVTAEQSNALIESTPRPGRRRMNSPRLRNVTGYPLVPGTPTPGGNAADQD